MADPISGSSSPIQSPGIDQTQKTQDTENVKAASGTPYDRALQQILAQHINSSHATLKDMAAQLREKIQERQAQGQEQHDRPDGLKRFTDKFARHLNSHGGMMSFPGGHHHGGLPPMHGLEQALTRIVSMVRSRLAQGGPPGQGEIPTPGPKGQPAPGDVPLESLQPRPNVMEAAGQEPVLAPAGNAPQLQQAMQAIEDNQPKLGDDDSSKVKIKDGQAQGGSLGQGEIPTPGPEGQPAPGDVPLESLQPRPNVMEAAGQEPVLAPAGNAPQQPEDSRIDGQSPNPAAAGNVPPPPELPAELQGPSDDPAVKEIQQAMMDFEQKWGDYSVKDNPDRLDEYNTDVANLSRQIAQFYSSMSSEYRS